MEKWADIPGFPGYRASDKGRVWSMKRGKFLRQQESTYDHVYVFAYVDGIQHKLYVHKAVLLAFSGPPLPGQQARHLNGHGGDNRLGNLVWGTPKENAEDKRKHGTQPRGERAGTARLTEEIVLQLPELLRHNSTRELGRRFGVSHTAIRRAALGIKWAHLRGGHSE